MPHQVSIARRRPVQMNDQQLVSFGPLDGKSLPLVVGPDAEDVDLPSWVQHNRGLVDQLLLQHGVLLFRGFKINSVERFKDFSRSLSDTLDGYDERTSPREHFGDNVFTSTVYPNDQPLLYHNANSYSTFWPMKIWFGCMIRAEKGGCTPLADCRRMMHVLEPGLLEEFSRRGVMYRRNFLSGMGLSWQETFGTQDRAEVAAYCAKEKIECEWVSEHHLRTTQIRQAVQQHPVTGDKVWFNQAALFHISMLKAGVAERFISDFAEEDLPSNAYYGDGGAIGRMELESIVEAYEKSAVRFDWQVGDVALMDNMLVAHARDPFEGERLITVAFSGRYSLPE